MRKALLAATQTQEIQAALGARDYAQALQLANAQLRNSARDAKLWTLQGIAFTGLGDNRRALEAYDKALGISPDYLPALEGAAELEYKAGSTRAISHLNRILQQRPDDPTSHAMLAALAYKQHDCATAAKHFAQSAHSLQPARRSGRVWSLPGGVEPACRSSFCVSACAMARL